MFKINKGFLVAVFSVMPLLANAANNDEWWEYTMTMDGMGDMTLPAQKDCYRKDNIIPSSGDDCTNSNTKNKGNKFSTDFSCKDGSSGHIDGMHSGSESSMKMTMKSAKGETSTMTSKGKKVGSCNWETDSSEAKACAQLNQSVSSAKTDIKKDCEAAVQDDKFDYFLAGATSENASANLAGKKCGGTVNSGCVEQRPKMCAKIQNTYLKDVTGEASGFKRVMGSKAGFDLAKVCKADTASASKQFCANRVKDVKGNPGNQDDIVKYCESDAKALFAKHCAGRDYTAQNHGGYSSICNPARKDGEQVEGGAASQPSATGSGDSNKGSVSPVEGAVKGAKKLKDLFGF